MRRAAARSPTGSDTGPLRDSLEGRARDPETASALSAVRETAAEIYHHIRKKNAIFYSLRCFRAIDPLADPRNLHPGQDARGRCASVSRTAVGPRAEIPAEATRQADIGTLALRWSRSEVPMR